MVRQISPQSITGIAPEGRLGVRKQACALVREASFACLRRQQAAALQGALRARTLLTGSSKQEGDAWDRGRLARICGRDGRGPRLEFLRSALNIHPRLMRICLGALAAVLLFMTTIPGVHAESVASKNKEGNRLYSEGKYAEAEKSYLDAQVKSPGKPEVLYNLGNSLIRQNKSDQGIQALHQSLSQGNSEIKTLSWYNTGNALFSKGNFQDAVQAYIQALKLHPSDKDAKHNLELSLMKLNQQNRKQTDPKQKPQNSENQKQSQAAQKKASNNTNEPNSQKAGEKQQQESPKQQAGSISKEQAQQILDAFQNRELEEQRKLRERRAGQRSNERDW